ncbi:rhamnogalacturonan acetylesterase [Sphingomonas cannabina]|uniref:rhamnogalacturonan acetylesterase n=1 Tax=Sphingomonas cannabina TaxID=2899123 RepID=UPI001F30D849|nr:rhamnogalacturonan acetylesterase [Sphingomonas cannabina]UIJ46384.1 rhamnogalacturonan acetylesterase [Sphingomonas cannabina]
MLLLAAALAAQAAPTTTPSPAQPIRASKIVLVGDSTTAVAGGWGGAFCADHVTSFVACVNLARGGRSSGSYRAEGSWDLALAEMKTPGFTKTWVLIQFGHNDQPGKPGRSTDLATEFPANLRRYVEETRAAGAIPVLVTPLTRRTFKNGQLDRDLDPWADAVRRVAAELKVPLVDLNAKSAAAVQAMGEAEADTLAQLPKGAAPAGDTTATEVNDSPFARRKLSFDRTHLGRKGADYFSAMVAHELAIAAPDTARLLYE